MSTISNFVIWREISSYLSAKERAITLHSTCTSFLNLVPFSTGLDLSNQPQSASQPVPLQSILNKYQIGKCTILAINLVQRQVLSGDVRLLSQVVPLRYLDLSATEIGSEDLTPLSKLTNLNTLRLIKTKIDNACVDHLLAISHLSSLDISFTGLTKEAIVKLHRQGNKDIKIVFRRGCLLGA